MANQRTRVLLGIAVVLAVLWVLDRAMLNGVDNEPLLDPDFAGLAAPNEDAQKAMALLKGQTWLDFRKPPETDPSIGGDPVLMNPFAFGVNRELERERSRALDEARRQAELVRTASQEPETEDVSPEIPFPGKVLGMMEDRVSGLRRVAVHWEDEVLVVETGESLGEFVVVSIDYEKVVLKHRPSGQNRDIWFVDEPELSEDWGW